MQITALEEYGIRCAYQLAKHHHDGPLAASRIAELEGLSVEYVSKIMHLFRKGGLVLASRGNQGGFYLAKNPELTYLDEVFSHLRSKKEMNESFCEKFPGQQTVCNHSGSCSIRPVWNVLSGYFNEILGSLTLNDILSREEDIEKHIKSIASKKANDIKSNLSKNPTQPSRGEATQ